MVVAVVGNAACSVEEAKLAQEIGEQLASRGATVICGGLGGAMEAVCRGAKLKGGLTVGILPGNDPDMANPWVDVAIATGVGQGRNAMIVQSAQAVIAIGGRYGTLSEIGHALKRGIPVVGLSTWVLSRGGKEDDTIIRARNVADAVDKALSLAQNKEGQR
ncbi:MAG: TIGR00725 family protein [Chloroflexota bacterium]|nr:TIGR00725 family protein [Chloroflexota bacterium]